MGMRSGTGNVRPYRRGASLPTLDGGDGKNRTSPKKSTGIDVSEVKSFILYCINQLLFYYGQITLFHLLRRESLSNVHYYV